MAYFRALIAQFGRGWGAKCASRRSQRSTVRANRQMATTQQAQSHRAPRPAQQKQGPRQSEIPVPESKSDRTARRCMQSDCYL